MIVSRLPSYVYLQISILNFPIFDSFEIQNSSDDSKTIDYQFVFSGSFSTRQFPGINV